MLNRNLIKCIAVSAVCVIFISFFTNTASADELLTLNSITEKKILDDLLEIQMIHLELYKETLSDETLLEMYNASMNLDSSFEFNFYNDLDYDKRLALYNELKVGGPLPHIFNIIVPGTGLFYSMSKLNLLANPKYALWWIPASVFTGFGAWATIMTIDDVIIHPNVLDDFNFLFVALVNVPLIIGSEIITGIFKKRQNTKWADFLLSDRPTYLIKVMTPDMEITSEETIIRVSLMSIEF